MATNRDVGRPAPLLSVAIAMVVIAAGCAGWFGWSWHDKAHSATLTAAQVRDQALQQGEQAVQNFNTLSYHNVAQGLALWKASSTGTLNRQLSSPATVKQFEQSVQKAKTITTAIVLDGALTSLNAQAQPHTADIIVALQITVTPVKGSPSTKRTRLEGALIETSSGWKLSALGQVAVGSTGSSATP
jgi:Mce-associated membrane protein